MLTFLERTLLDEIKEAHSILEDYHDKCVEVISATYVIDETAEETEYCSTFSETYGNDWDRPTCYEHDKLREWHKILNANGLGINRVASQGVEI